MADLDRAIAAAREALAKYDRAELVDELIPCAAHSSETLRDLLAALDAARSEAVAWPTCVLSRDETLRVLSEHNAWRRGAKGEQTDPRLLGLALDAAVAFIATPPAAAVPEGYALVQKWREQANAALRRSGTWNGNDMADRIDDMADELEAMLAAANKENTQ